MKTMVTLPHEEPQCFWASALFGKTREGSRGNGGCRRSLYSRPFTRREQQRISHIKSIAHKWYLVTGVPEKVRMSYDNYLLWQRLAEFCATV